MRKLIYVPVIHVESDLGSIAPEIDKKSAEVCGKERWEKHKQTVVTFWDVIEGFFRKLDAGNLKIYQDGLMAGGDLGLRIVEEGAKRGSRNYQIVRDLMKRGAEIRKTEDVELLKEELNQILRIAQNSSAWEKTVAHIGKEVDRETLLEKRDRFIAKTISGTLEDGESGVLFIGAFHDVVRHLARDIVVDEVKSRQKVKNYFNILLSGGDDKEFEELAGYLVRRPTSNVQSPVSRGQ